VAGLEPPEPVDTDFGIGGVREIPPPLPSPLGAGYLILALRPDSHDGLADFVVLLEPRLFQGPR
jgi:hypothetical protein